MNATYEANSTSEAPATAGRARARTSKAGAGVVASRATKASSNSAPISRRPTTHGLDHPRRGASMSAAMMGTSATRASAAPATSRGTPAGPRPRGSTRMPATRATPRMGTGSRNAQRQPMAATTTPPSTGPSARPSAPADAHVPSARVRSDGAKAIAVIAMAGASIIPAPTPMSARARMSTGNDSASPPSSDATPNNAIPARKTPLRPNRSATAAPGTSRLVSATV